MLDDSLGINDSIDMTKIDTVPKPKYYDLELVDSIIISDSVKTVKVESVTAPTSEPRKYDVILSDGLGIVDSVKVTKIESVSEPKSYKIKLTDSLGVIDSIDVTKIESAITSTPAPIPTPAPIQTPAPIPSPTQPIITDNTAPSKTPSITPKTSGSQGGSPSSSSGGGFTISSNMIVWDHCNDAENYTILIASTYGDNLYSQIKSSESSYNGINVTAETDFKKYISNTRIPINFYAFSFDGIDQSDIYEITIYDKSKKFVSSKVSFENCSGSVIIFEPKGIVLNNFEPNILDEKVIPGKVSYDDIISLCDAKEDKSIITKASTEKLYCVYNSSVEKLMYRGWATQ